MDFRPFFLPLVRAGCIDIDTLTGASAAQVGQWCDEVGMSGKSGRLMRKRLLRKWTALVGHGNGETGIGTTQRGLLDEWVASCSGQKPLQFASPEQVTSWFDEAGVVDDRVKDQLLQQWTALSPRSKGRTDEVDDGAGVCGEQHRIRVWRDGRRDGRRGRFGRTRSKAEAAPSASKLPAIPVSPIRRVVGRAGQQSALLGAGGVGGFHRRRAGDQTLGAVQTAARRSGARHMGLSRRSNAL